MGSFQLQSLDLNQRNTCIRCAIKSLQVKNNSQIMVSFLGGGQGASTSQYRKKQKYWEQHHCRTKTEGKANRDLKGKKVKTQRKREEKGGNPEKAENTKQKQKKLSKKGWKMMSKGLRKKRWRHQRGLRSKYTAVSATCPEPWPDTVGRRGRCCHP